MEQGKPFSATESPLVDFDAVCQKVRTAVEPARAHAVSLHDENGDVLWLSESSMGPDEHNAVREALESFANGNAAHVLAYDLGDARSAVLLRAVNARRALVGAIMVIMDSRVVKPDDRGSIKIMTPKLQRVIADFAAMRPDIEGPREAAPAPAAAPTAAKPAAKPAALASVKTPAKSELPVAQARAHRGARALECDSSPLRAAAVAAPRRGTGRRGPSPPIGHRPAAVTAHSVTAPPTARRTAPHRTGRRPIRRSTPRAFAGRLCTRARRAADALRAPDGAGALAAKAPPVSPEIDRLHAALRRSPIALHVQRLVPLTKGSQLKRYEVLLRSKGRRCPERRSPGDAEGGRRQWPGLHDRSARDHRARRLAGASSRRVAIDGRDVLGESHRDRAAR